MKNQSRNHENVLIYGKHLLLLTILIKHVMNQLRLSVATALILVACIVFFAITLSSCQSSRYGGKCGHGGPSRYITGYRSSMGHGY